MHSGLDEHVDCGEGVGLYMALCVAASDVVTHCYKAHWLVYLLERERLIVEKVRPACQTTPTLEVVRLKIRPGYWRATLIQTSSGEDLRPCSENTKFSLNTNARTCCTLLILEFQCSSYFFLVKTWSTSL